MSAPGVADLDRNSEAFGYDRLAIGDADWGAIGVAQLVGRAGAQDLADVVYQARGDGAQGLLVVMTFANHEPPIHLGQTRIDAACCIGGKEQRSLDAVVAGLSDGLSWPVASARGIGSREHAAKAAELVQTCEASGGSVPQDPEIRLPS